MQRPTTVALPKSQIGTIAGLLWSPVAVFLIALAVRLVASAVLPLHVDESWHFHADEPWHLLAAKSWNAEGTLRVYDGEYPRAGYYSIVVAWFMRMFGETMAIGRLPSVLASALLVAGVFVWLRRQSGAVAAWVAASLFCFENLTLNVAAMVRFYAPQALFLWLAAIIVYAVTAGDPGRRRPFWALVPAIACLAVGLYLQKTGAVVALALGLWVACDVGYRFRLLRWLGDHRVLFGLAAAAILVLGLAVIADAPARLAGLYAEFRETALFNLEQRNAVFYYHRMLSDKIPILWGLFPLALIVALAHRPRATIFCAFMSLIPIAIMSFGGMKAQRYIFFAYPFFFTIWGVAAEAALPVARRWAAGTWERIVEAGGGAWTGASRIQRLVLACVMIGVPAFAVLSQSSYNEAVQEKLLKGTARLLANPGQLFVGPTPEPWTSHREELAQLADNASIFLTADVNQTLLWFGPYDMALGRYAPGDGVETDREFAIDPRTGHPIVGSVDSLQKLMMCYSSGLVLVPDYRWRGANGVDDTVADFLVTHTEASRLETRGSPITFLVFQWHDRPAGSDSECAEIRDLPSRTSTRTSG